MKKILITLLCFGSLLGSAQEANLASKSEALKKLTEKLSLQTPRLEVNLGLVVKHQEGFAIPRLTLAANNLFKSGLGFYVTPEYRGGIVFEEDGTDFYFRMPMGMSLEIGNIGFFFGADPISAAAGKNWRKEMGMVYSNPSKLPVDFRVGYSTWVGPTLGVGYRFPMSK